MIDWVLIITMSLAIVAICLLVVICINAIVVTRKIKELDKKKNKKQSKRKRARKKRILTKKRAKLVKQGVFSFVFIVVVSLGGGYAKYYQMTTISEIDGESLDTGRYLLVELEKQLAETPELNENDDINKENIHGLAIRLASLRSQKASYQSSEEGQLQLNHYYSAAGELGVNLSAQDYNELIEKDELVEAYLNDIANVQKKQVAVFDFYEISEDETTAK